MKKNRGEISTILTIGTLVFLTVSTFIANYFSSKNKTIKTKAQIYGPQYCRNTIQGIRGEPCSYFYKCDIEGRCNPACCQVDSHCPNGQRCSISNGYCISGKSCDPNSGTTNNTPNPTSNQPLTQPNQSQSIQSNGCFSLSANFEVRDERWQDEQGNPIIKKAFYASVTFNSERGGDIKLDYNGIHVAGWNRFNGGSFTYSPQWTQPHTHAHEAGIAALTPGQKIDFTYRGMHSGCSPQDVTISCSVGVRGNGETYVSGNGCSCRNCGGGVSLPTNTPIPTPIPTSTSQYLTPTLTTTTFPYYIRPTELTSSPTRVSPGASSTITPPEATPTRPYRPLPLTYTPTPTMTPSFTPVPTSTLTPTSTPIPTSTPPPKCDVKDEKYCIEYSQTERELNGRTGSFPWCQLPDGKWVKLVSTGTYDEECYYSFNNDTIKGLKGLRKVKRENGNEKYKYGCLYKINIENNDIICNSPDGHWNNECTTFCELNSNYKVTIILKSDFLKEIFPFEINDGPNKINISFDISDNKFSHNITVDENAKNKDLDVKFLISKQTLINYFNYFFSFSSYPKITIEVTRTASGLTDILYTEISMIINPDDLSFVISSYYD